MRSLAVRLAASPVCSRVVGAGTRASPLTAKALDGAPPMPRSLIDQQIALREERVREILEEEAAEPEFDPYADDPILAVYELGHERRECALCDGYTYRPTRVCRRHDWLRCCGSEVLPMDGNGHSPYCRTPERLPVDMEVALLGFLSQGVLDWGTK